jgi:outer membrane receptor protein involved in Fe transport
VAKGYVSVIDGPGGIGGAINLVTRKPSEPFEGEILVRSRRDPAAHEPTFRPATERGRQAAGQDQPEADFRR